MEYHGKVGKGSNRRGVSVRLWQIHHPMNATETVVAMCGRLGA